MSQVSIKDKRVCVGRSRPELGLLAFGRQAVVIPPFPEAVRIHLETPKYIIAGVGEEVGSTHAVRRGGCSAIGGPSHFEVLASEPQIV